LLWSDPAVPAEKISEMKSYQVKIQFLS